MILSQMLPPNANILCTNPVFGPGLPLDGIPFVYQWVRASNAHRTNYFLSTSGCRARWSRWLRQITMSMLLTQNLSPI